MKRHLISALLIALAVSASQVATAAAASEPTPDQVYTVVTFVGQPTSKTSVAKTEMLTKARQGGASQMQLAAVSNSSGCWQGGFWVQGKNVFGWVLFQYNETHNWCGDGKWITYTNATAWGSNLFLGVAYKGTAVYQNYGVGWNVWQRYDTGHFTYFDVTWGTLYNYTPQMSFYVTGSGARQIEDNWNGATCSKLTC